MEAEGRQAGYPRTERSFISLFCSLVQLQLLHGKIRLPALHK